MQKEDATSNTKINFSLDGKNPLVYSTVENTNRKNSLRILLLLKIIRNLWKQTFVFLLTLITSFKLSPVLGALSRMLAAETFAKLPKDKQEEVLRDYYDTTDGIGYNMVRTNINSCDFSSDSYVYIQTLRQYLKYFFCKA